MIHSSYTLDKIHSLSEDAFALYERSRLGEKKEDSIVYAPIEALFLLSERKITIFSKSKPLSFDSLLSKIKKQDKNITTKLAVFTDLRKKGYIVKTALKFGAQFRIYERGIKPGEDHARFLLYTAREHDDLSWHDFAAKNRVAHSSKKRLLIAIVDDEGDISYYECGWLKP